MNYLAVFYGGRMTPTVVETLKATNAVDALEEATQLILDMQEDYDGMQALFDDVAIYPFNNESVLGITNLDDVYEKDAEAKWN